MDKRKHKSPEHQAKITKAMKGRKVTWMPKIIRNREQYASDKYKQERINNARTASKICNQRIEAEAELLRKDGFIAIPITEVRPDIIAIKDGKLYAVEVEYQQPNYSKYDKNNYRKHFEDVIWIIRKK